MPIDFSKRVRVTKTRSNDERSQENHAEGYWVAGLIPFGQRPVEGGILLLDRDTRNGVEIKGCFRSSIIKDTVMLSVGGWDGATKQSYQTEHLIVTTNNSTYKLEQADEQ